MNERVQVTSQGFTTQYAFGLNGQRVSSWDGIACAPTLLSANTYWNGTPVSVFDGYQSSYQHQDLLGTKRLLTGSDGSVIGASTSLPFGDGLSLSGTDTDPYHFAGLDHDAESDTEHASFRQYSSTSGRWMSPDPYDGSYDFTNPQSLNRYTYVLNNPLMLMDPSGLDYCLGGSSTLPYNPATGQYGGYPDLDTELGCEAAGGTWVLDNPDPGNPGSTEPTLTGEADNGMYTYTLSTYAVDYGMYLNGLEPAWVILPFGPSSYTGTNDTGTSIGGGGGAARTPWYENSCVQKALLKGVASAGIDAIGLIPEGGGAETVARGIGHLGGYRGIVADNFGKGVIQQAQHGADTFSLTQGLGEQDWLSTGISVAGFIPGLGQAAAIGSIIMDTYNTAKAINQCP